MLSELLRVADQAVVSVPNFGHWKVRWALLSRGRMPETGALPEPWYSTPNIHLCTLRDFVSLCDALELRIDACASLAEGKPGPPHRPAAAHRELARRDGPVPAQPQGRGAGRDRAHGFVR